MRWEMRVIGHREDAKIAKVEGKIRDEGAVERAAESGDVALRVSDEDARAEA
jgi:hypothetical protein